MSKSRLALMAAMMSVTPTLPYDAEVEYLESNGTQWIDVGFKGDMDVDYEVVAKVTSNNAVQNILGDRASTTENRYGLMVDTRTTRSVGGYFNCGNSNQVSFATSYDIYSYLTYKKVGADVYIGTTKIGTFTTQSFTTPNNIILFGARYAGRPSYLMEGEIKSCKFSKNGVLLRDFIPVRVGQVGYMYDRVSGQLFGSAGSGDFTIGNDVT